MAHSVMIFLLRTMFSWCAHCILQLSMTFIHRSETTQY